MVEFLTSLGLSSYAAKISVLLFDGTIDTFYMVFLATAISIIVGVPLGVILLVTSKGYFWYSPVFYSVLGSSFVIIPRVSLRVGVIKCH